MELTPEKHFDIDPKDIPRFKQQYKELAEYLDSRHPQYALSSENGPYQKPDLVFEAPALTGDKDFDDTVQARFSEIERDREQYLSKLVARNWVPGIFEESMRFLENVGLLNLAQTLRMKRDLLPMEKERTGIKYEEVGA